MLSGVVNYVAAYIHFTHARKVVMGWWATSVDSCSNLFCNTSNILRLAK
jgi:hypothetical protein